MNQQSRKLLNMLNTQEFGFSDHKINTHHNTLENALLTVFKIVLFADLFGDRLHFLVKALRHIGEEMVFNLVV